MLVKYSGPFSDATGFGEAARNNVFALHSAGVDVLPENCPYSPVGTKFEHTDLIQSLTRKFTSKTYRIKVSHYNPREFPLRAEKGKYNIGYAVWETNKWPDMYVENCNQMDEIWTPSCYNIEGAQSSGIRVPVTHIPHTAVMQVAQDKGASILNADSDVYLFYSILTWQARKNPEALLVSFLTEFQPHEKVALLLKVLAYSTQEQQMVKEQIRKIKTLLNLPSYPKILLVSQVLDQDVMCQLHHRGDCFVLLHRSEGWGLGHFEAMIYGKPVIATNYSGVTEFFNESTGFPVNYRLTPVMQSYPYYNGSQLWGDPDILHARQVMRYVFEHQQEAQERGYRAKVFVRENFSPNIVGSKMCSRLAVL